MLYLRYQATSLAVRPACAPSRGPKERPKGHVLIQDVGNTTSPNPLIEVAVADMLCQGNVRRKTVFSLLISMVARVPVEIG